MDALVSRLHDLGPEASVDVDQMALRAAVLWQPAPGLKIEPSIQYQNRLNHGTDTGGYYLGLSNPAAGQFNEATPTAMQDRDHFTLAARL